MARRGVSRFEKALSRILQPRGGLFLDAIRASIIIYIAFFVGGLAGTRDYSINVVEATSRLPKVVAIAPATPDDAKEAAARFPDSLRHASSDGSPAKWRPPFYRRSRNRPILTRRRRMLFG